MQKAKKQMDSFFNWITRYISPALLAVLGIGIITSILLFMPPVNGLADNGEYFRVLNSNSLFRNDAVTYDNASYFIKDFSIMRYFNQTQTNFVSTQQLFITLAIWLNKLVYSQTVFDIRFLGFIYLLFFLPAIYLLVRGLTEGVSLKKSYLIALLTIFILGDSSYTIYFNSFYTEAASFLLSVCALSLGVYFYRVTKRDTWLRKGVLFLLTVTFMLMLGTSRQEYLLIVGVLIVGFGLFSYIRQKNQRLSLSAVLLSFLGFTIFATIVVPSDVYNRDLYHSLTRGVMMETQIPGKRLAEGGINQQYGLEKGRSYYEEYSPVAPTSEQVQKELLDKASFTWVFLNYVNHPTELWSILNRAVSDVYLVKPNDVGNYEEKAGREPLEQTQYFMLYNRIKASFFPKTFAFYLLLTAVILGIYGVGFYNGVKLKQPRLIFRFFLMSGILINLLVVFVSAIIIDGDSDLVRHLFLVSLYLDFLLLQLVSDVLGKRLWSDKDPIELEEVASDETK